MDVRNDYVYINQDELEKAHQVLVWGECVYLDQLLVVQYFFLIEVFVLDAAKGDTKRVNVDWGKLAFIE